MINCTEARSWISPSPAKCSTSSFQTRHLCQVPVATKPSRGVPPGAPRAASRHECLVIVWRPMMPIYRFGSRYSRWDGTQQIGPLSADDLMRAMSEDLMQDGDVNRALQRLFRWGFQRPDGEEVPGLQGLMQRLRDRRQEQLERYDLQSMLSDIADRIEQIVATERQGIAKRLDETQQGQSDQSEAETTPRQEAREGTDSSANRVEPASGSGQDRSEE